MIGDEARPDTFVCPGCGGRNEVSARECDWCGRLFVAEHRQDGVRWLAPAGVIAALVLLLGVMTFALVGSRSAERSVTQIPAPPTAQPQRFEVTDVAVLEPTRRPATPTFTAIEVDDGVEFVAVANTGGAGAFIRREAGAGSPGIVAYRDGTILKIVGDDVSAEGRTWRQVEDRQGNRGWTPREFLQPSDTGF